jgi:phosphoribosylamine--glycine ligase
MQNKQKILIIGGGGREHAIGWKIAQSERRPELYFAPGNAGTAQLGVNVPIKATDIEGLIEFAKTEKIGLTLAIPDDPLALGVVDEFRKNNLPIFGPTKAAAELEASKAFAKRFMKKHNLPTAKFEIFDDFGKVVAYLGAKLPSRSLAPKFPIVIKASGLALGKGVIIAKTKEEALTTLSDILLKKIFGEAGREVIIEEFLEGPEISSHAFSDGISYKIFPPSQDHKKIGENDIGLNTGGMGTIAPLPFVSKKLMAEIEKEIIAPTLIAMKKENRPYEGILYPGLILTKDGPKILEFNARFGDPETQSYMRLLENDLLDVIGAILEKKLSELEIKWKNISACTIVLASGGYPGNYEKGKIISGLPETEKEKDIVIFQAGTKLNEKGELVTNGGRVLGISAVGNNLREALNRAYEAIPKIYFEGMQYRRDIGKKAFEC